MLAIARATDTEEVSVDVAGLAAKVVPPMLRRPAVARPGPPVSELLSLSGDGGRIREWVAQAHERTAVEAIESPPGFVAECDAAPGALAFASTAEAAIEEMRSVLHGWASLRVERGHDLPHLRRGTVAR